MFDLFSSKLQSKSSNSTQSNASSSYILNPAQAFSIQMNKILESISAKDMQQNNKRFEAFFKAIQAWKTLQIHYVTKLAQIKNNFQQKVMTQSIQSNRSNRYIPSSQSNISVSNHSPTRSQKVDQSVKSLHIELIDNQLVLLFTSLIQNHNAMLQKINYDITLVNLDISKNLNRQIKELLAEEKSLSKCLNSSKDQLQKVLSKKSKLQKQKEQELMLQIFMQDSIDITMEQKIRRFNKYKEIEKQKQQYQLKVDQSVDAYQIASQNLKKNHLKYYQKIDKLNECKYETVLKMQLHLLTFYRNLVHKLYDITKDESQQQSPEKPMRDSFPTKSKIISDGTFNPIFQDIEKKLRDNKKKLQQTRKMQIVILEKVSQRKIGYVQYSLKLIIQKEIDDLLLYSKDKDVKTKIKRMMQSNEINPQETDQMCRQIQLIKNIIKSSSQQKELLQVFKNMVNKNSKLRMNFIFILQFFRLNGKFEMTVQQFKPLYRLINQFLEACHNNRDCFVLKQLMILLMTYFVTLQQDLITEQLQKSISLTQTIQTHKSSDSRITQANQLSPTKSSQISQKQVKKSTSTITKQKIYILNFFKDHEVWRDLQFWESLLIECVYSQKKNTLKMLMVGLQSNHKDLSVASAQKKQMMQAQKTAIMNQLLYVVKNMIIFQFTQKDVKNFSIRFCKLLKQDDRCLKDVNKTIEDAAKQQIQTKQHQSIAKYLQKWLK